MEALSQQGVCEHGQGHRASCVSPLEGKAKEIIQLYHLPAINITNDPRFDCAGVSWRRGGSTEQREIIDSRVTPACWWPAPSHLCTTQLLKLVNMPPMEPRRSQMCALDLQMPLWMTSFKAHLQVIAEQKCSQ